MGTPRNLMKQILLVVGAVSFLQIGFLFGSQSNNKIPQGVILNSGSGLDEIQAVTDVFLGAWNEGDADGCSNTYAKDAVFMPPGLPSIHGRDAIKTFFL